MGKSWVLCGVCLLFGAAATGAAQETAVPPEKIPQVVREALVKKFPQAQITKCTQTTEDGDTVYDIEFLQKGRKCEADIKANGVYVNYEQAIAASALPKAVRDGIDKRYPRAVLKEVMEEKEVQGTTDRLSAYEVVLATAEGKEAEVRVSPDGQILEDSGVPQPEKKK